MKRTNKKKKITITDLCDIKIRHYWLLNFGTSRLLKTWNFLWHLFYDKTSNNWSRLRFYYLWQTKNHTKQNVNLNNRFLFELVFFILVDIFNNDLRLRYINIASCGCCCFCDDILQNLYVACTAVNAHDTCCVISMELFW